MNFLPHQLLGINFDRSNNLNVLFVFFLLSSTYFSGLSSSFRLLISFVHVLFLFLFTQVLQNTKAKCLCANLVTGCFLVSFFSSRVCVFVRSLLKASSLCQMFEHLYVFVFVRYLSQCWHLFLVID
jgi:hypothetical protein